MRYASLSLLALFLCTFAYGAGHEVTVPIYAPSVIAPYSPAVATNGTSFLTLWRFGQAIYGSLADADGRAVTPIPFQVDVNNAASFQIVAVGGVYTLYWSDGTNSYLGNIESDGHVTNVRGPIAVEALYRMSIASTGSEILVVGETNAASMISVGLAHILRIDGAVVARSLRVSDTWGLREATATKDEFIVTATENSGVFLFRFTLNGELKAPEKIQVSAPGRRPPVHGVSASAGDAIVVVWSESAEPLHILWSALVSNDGAVVQTRQLPSADSRFIPDSGVVWDGNAYVVAAITTGYSQSETTLAFRLDRSGAPIDPPVAVGSVIQHLATNGSIVYGVGVQPSTAPQLIATSFDNSPITPRRSDVLSRSLTAQRNAAVGSDGFDFMTAFVDQTATAGTVKIARISRAGTPIPGSEIVLGGSAGLSNVAIAHGDGYLVIWANEAGVFARRVSDNGVVRDTQPITIATNAAQKLCVVWNGMTFFVVWSNDRDVMGAIIQADGRVSSPRSIMRNAPFEPRVAWNGKMFLVIAGIPQACPPFFECTASRGLTFAVRVAPDGAPIDEVGIQVDQSTHAQEYGKGHATVASDGLDFLVAIDEAQDVVAVAVKADGTVGNPSTIFRWFDHVKSDLAFDGTDYVLAWHYTGATTSWLATVHLTATGALKTAKVIEFRGSESPPAVIANDLGQTLIMASENNDQYLKLPRLRAYLETEAHVTPSPPAAPNYVTAIGASHTLVVNWSANQEAEGVRIDTTMPGLSYLIGVEAPASQQSVAMTRLTLPPTVYVRTFNAGGFSEAVAATVLPPGRRRSSRR